MQLPRALPSLLLLVAAVIACRPAYAASNNATTAYHHSADSGIINFKSASGCAFELILNGASPYTTKITNQFHVGRLGISQFLRSHKATEKNPLEGALMAVATSNSKSVVLPVHLWGGKVV